MITDLIASTTVGSGGTTTTIEFASIPSTYTDLVVLFSPRVPSATPQPQLRLNNYTSEYYKWEALNSTAASVVAFNDTFNTYANLGLIPGSFEPSTSFGNILIQIPNYAGTTVPKTFKSQLAFKDNTSTVSQRVLGGSFDSFTAAVTSIQLISSTAYSQYTTAYLYGTLKGSGGATVS